MKDPQQIIKELDSMYSHRDAEKYIADIQKEAWNEAVQLAVKTKKRMYDEDGNLYVSCDRIKELMLP